MEVLKSFNDCLSRQAAEAEVVTEVGKIKGVGTLKFEKISIYEGFLLVIKFFYSYETLSM